MALELCSYVLFLKRLGSVVMGLKLDLVKGVVLYTSCDVLSAATRTERFGVR